VGDAELGAERVPGDRLPVPLLVVGCGAAGRREQGLVLGVLRRGRPSRRGKGTGVAVLAGDAGGGLGAAGGAALDHGDRDQEGTLRDGGHDAAPRGWLRLGQVRRQAEPYPPASTTVGHDSCRVVIPSCLSRWRSRAAITQVRSMQTATAQDIGPCWPCWAAVSRMWVNDPAPARCRRVLLLPYRGAAAPVPVACFTLVNLLPARPVPGTPADGSFRRQGTEAARPGPGRARNSRHLHKSGFGGLFSCAPAR